MRQKLVTTLCAVAMLAVAIQAMAANVKVVDSMGGVTLTSTADSWYVDVPGAGTVTLKDNKKTFDLTFDEADNYFVGLQKGFTGQLKLVGFESVVIPHDYVDVSRPATCTEYGYCMMSCQYCDGGWFYAPGLLCGDPECTGVHEPLGHNWVRAPEWGVDIEPTCTESGVWYWTCETCETWGVTYPDALDHAWTFSGCDGEFSYFVCDLCDAEDFGPPCGDCPLCHPPAEETIVQKLNELAQGITLPITGPVTLIVDDVEFVFVSNSGNYGNNTLHCTKDGVKYKLVIGGDGAISVVLA